MFLFIRYVILLLYNIAMYLFTGYSLYTIAKRGNVKYSFLAWVPILQYGIIGAIAEEYVIFGYRVRHLNLVMCGLAFLQIFSGYTFIFGIGLIGFAAKIAIAVVMHKFFYLYDPSTALIFAILCVCGRLPFAILLFLTKDKMMIMSPGAYPYPFANKP